MAFPGSSSSSSSIASVNSENMKIIEFDFQRFMRVFKEYILLNVAVNNNRSYSIKLNEELIVDIMNVILERQCYGEGLPFLSLAMEQKIKCYRGTMDLKQIEDIWGELMEKWYNGKIHRKLKLQRPVCLDPQDFDYDAIRQDIIWSLYVAQERISRCEDCIIHEEQFDLEYSVIWQKVENILERHKDDSLDVLSLSHIKKSFQELFDSFKKSIMTFRYINDEIKVIFEKMKTQAEEYKAIRKRLDGSEPARPITHVIPTTQSLDVVSYRTKRRKYSAPRFECFICDTEHEKASKESIRIEWRMGSNHYVCSDSCLDVYVKFDHINNALVDKDFYTQKRSDPKRSGGFVVYRLNL